MDFSIVIPTLNRADMLRHALASALAQDHSSYEVLVSNNASTDTTPEVLEQAASSRLRVVQTERPLSMPEHWEFAVGRARGEWIVILCDDDALFPNALSQLHTWIRDPAHRGIELIHYSHLTYLYDDGMQGKGNHVRTPHRIPVSAQRLSSRLKLKDIYWRMGFNFPKMLNCATHRDLLNRIQQRHGRLFSEWAPDFSSGAKLLAHAHTHLRTGPLFLWGENMASYGAGSWKDPAHLLRFLRQFSTFNGQLDHTPYPDIITVYNVVNDTLLRVREELGEEGRGLVVDPVRYRRLLRSDLKKYVDLGFEAFGEMLARVELHYARERRRRWLQPRDWFSHQCGKVRGLDEQVQRAWLKCRGRWLAGKTEELQFDNIQQAAAAVANRVIPF